MHGNKMLRIGDYCPSRVLEYYQEHPPSETVYIYEIDNRNSPVISALFFYKWDERMEHEKLYPAPDYGENKNPYNVDKADHNANVFMKKVQVPWKLIPGWTILNPKTKELKWQRNRAYRNPSRLFFRGYNDWLPTWILKTPIPGC